MIIVTQCNDQVGLVASISQYWLRSNSISVNHSFTAADMIKAGKEIETAVLARPLKLAFEDRVFVYKNKTVVFK